MAIRVGRWDCERCGHVGNLGPLICCSQCGGPRGENVRFYLPENAEIVTDIEEIQRARAGSDWVCGHCGSGNARGNSVCYACGNPFDPEDASLGAREYGMGQVPRSEREHRDADRPALAPQKRMSRGKRLLLAVVAVLFLIGSGIGYLIYSEAWDAVGWDVTWEYAVYGLQNETAKSEVWLNELAEEKDTVKVTVSDHSWKRIIRWEELTLAVEEGDVVPSGGSVVSSRQVVSHYEKIFSHNETKYRTVREVVGTESYVCGKRDLGNGYFEDKYCTRNIYEKRKESYQEPVYRKEPVYKTVYTYRIHRWVKIAKGLESGKDLQPIWPKPESEGGLGKFRGKEREEFYFLYATGANGKEFREAVPYRTWRRTRKGRKLRAAQYLLSDGPNNFVNLK